jgi:hypothetical protein
MVHQRVLFCYCAGPMRSFVAAILVSAFVVLFAVLARFDGPARAQQAPAGAPKCKLWRGSNCCDPAISAHLPKEAVFSACGESPATFLGEQAQKDTCKYVFKVEGKKEEDTFVQVYAPAQKQVPTSPNDPFFRWKKIGKVFVTDKAMSPKSAPILASSTGLWMPGQGYSVSINASTSVCTKPEAERLSKSLH